MRHHKIYKIKRLVKNKLVMVIEGTNIKDQDSLEVYYWGQGRSKLRERERYKITLRQESKDPFQMRRADV